jgi:hypothetical protein
MDRRFEEVIRLPHEAVCDVNDNAPGYWLCFDPVSRLGKHFQACVLVLRDKGEALEVCMSANA